MKETKKIKKNKYDICLTIDYMTRDSAFRDYITTARAKGMKETAVIYKEMLPNAMMPTITNLGRTLASIIAGTPVIESIFSIPGVGNYLLTAINQRDYPAVRASVLFLALCVSLIMLAVDLAYAAVDPRIRAKFSRGGK